MAEWEGAGSLRWKVGFVVAAHGGAGETTAILHAPELSKRQTGVGGSVARGPVGNCILFSEGHHHRLFGALCPLQTPRGNAGGGSHFKDPCPSAPASLDTGVFSLSLFFRDLAGVSLQAAASTLTVINRSGHWGSAASCHPTPRSYNYPLRA